MDSEEFRKCAKELIDFAADYIENSRTRRVLPNVQPGFMQSLLPESPPEEGEPWQDIVKDIEKVIMPGMTHWNSPHFHAYFPTANSYPAMCADILSSALACIGFTWMSSPSCTELEMIMMDWLGQILQLPDEFLFRSNKSGGGVIQGTASEATLVGLLAARTRAIHKMKDQADFTIEKLVAYASDQSHSSVEKAALLGAVQIRLLPSDDNLCLRGETLATAIRKDRNKGLVPFFVIATLGSTNTCAFDDLTDIGPVCAQEKLWLHVDAAYAGSSFICSEFRHLLNGVQFADSFNFNPHKWMLVNFDCSTMWVKNQHELSEAFSVHPTYLKHEKEGQIPDYRHWQIPLGRRFRSLKLWFVFRSYGVEGIRKHIRTQVQLAKEFEKMLVKDPIFEITHPVILGLVCFRVKASNAINEEILKKINERGHIHITPTIVKDRYTLRFAVCSRMTVLDDIKYAYDEIKTVSTMMLK